MPRLNLNELPHWPRMLGRVEAAAYLGVSVDVFDQEVKDAVWPAPRRRGAGGGKHTWDRLALDRCADVMSGLVASEGLQEAAVTDAAMSSEWGARLNGAGKGQRSQSRH